MNDNCRHEEMEPEIINQDVAVGVGSDGFPIEVRETEEVFRCKKCGCIPYDHYVEKDEYAKRNC